MKDFTLCSIAQEFKDSGYKHRQNIHGNRVFVTDSTVSTLALVSGNIVIEYYMLLPNVVVPMHYHPFNNQMIFISGELTAYRQMADGITSNKQFSDSDANYVGSILPKGEKHGFKVGGKGCIMYNIQIWDEGNNSPLSAALRYTGEPMGEKHRTQLAAL